MSDVDLRVLKNILSDKAVAVDFVNSNDVNLFTDSSWTFAKAVYDCIKKYNETPTLRVLQEFCNASNTGLLSSLIPEMWEKVQAADTNLSELPHDLDVLKSRFAEKQILKLKSEFENVKPGSVNVGDVLGKFQKTLVSINNLNDESMFSSKDTSDYVREFIDNFKDKQNNPEENQGLLTHYSFLDNRTNGLKPADMLLIAGESGKGKSLFLQNIATQMWMGDNTIDNYDFDASGKDIIYFSLEMPYADCFLRLISKMSGVPYRDIENAKVGKEGLARLRKCLMFMEKYPNKFRIVDMVDASANDIEVELVKSGKKYDAVFVDYLGIMKTNETSNESDWLRQGTIAYELRRIARKFSTTVLSAVQLNRKPQKEGSESVGLSRMARSKEIATHATHIIQIESRDKEESYPDFIYHFIKNRKGPLGKGTLNKNFACTTLIDKPYAETSHGYEYMATDISEELGNAEDLEF